MDIAQLILDEIKAQYAAGKSQEELAKQFGCSHVYINRLLSGKRPTDGLSVKYLQKMFPRASISLYGEQNNISGLNIGDHSKSYGSTVIGDAKNVTLNGEQSSKVRIEERRRISDIIMADPGITSDIKITLYNQINKEA